MNRLGCAGFFLVLTSLALPWVSFTLGCNSTQLSPQTGLDLINPRTVEVQASAGNSAGLPQSVHGSFELHFQWTFRAIGLLAAAGLLLTSWRGSVGFAVKALIATGGVFVTMALVATLQGSHFRLNTGGREATGAAGIGGVVAILGFAAASVFNLIGWARAGREGRAPPAKPSGGLIWGPSREGHGEDD